MLITNLMSWYVWVRTMWGEIWGHVWVFGEWREGGRGREECRESDPAIYIYVT